LPANFGILTLPFLSLIYEKRGLINAKKRNMLEIMEETTLRSLIDTVKACSDAGKRYCFIIGAGASKASGIKTGWEMAKEWMDELQALDAKAARELIEKEQVDKDDLGSHYSKIYGRRFALEPAQGFIRLQKEMENAIPSSGYYYLAEILNETHNKLVITTNFDSLTEDALFIYKDTKALVITHESLAKYVDALPDRPIVIKLHRDLLLQPKSTEEEVHSLSDEWEGILKKIFEIYVPIVIGYGGNDGSLMGFLESVADKNKPLYWCYKNGTPVNDKIKELLGKYRGFLIPIDDFDDTMHNFGVKFGFGFSGETIKNVTNERAGKLIDKYNEWMENRRKILDKKESRSDTENMTFDSFRFLSSKRIASLEQRIADERQSAADYYMLGIEYFLKDENGKALENYSKAIELEPDNAAYFNSRGVSYHHLKEYEKAVADCTKAIELEPSNAVYYHNRGNNYNWLKEHEKAVADQTKAIELEPGNAKHYYARGVSYSWLNDYEKAVADETKAIELAPADAAYYNSRGKSYDLLNEYEKAVADFTKAIDLEPNNADCFLSLARTLCWLNDFNNAYANLHKAMSLDDKLPRCYAVRGIIGLKMAKHDKEDCKPEVLGDLDKAIELDADNVPSYLYRAEYYLYSNNLDSAYTNLEKALSIDDRDGCTYFFMARYHEMRGDKQEAERCMSKSKELRFIPHDSDY